LYLSVQVGVPGCRHDGRIPTFGQGHDKGRKVEFLSHLIHLGLERLDFSRSSSSLVGSPLVPLFLDAPRQTQ
jgi:hypothetical protein